MTSIIIEKPAIGSGPGVGPFLDFEAATRPLLEAYEGLEAVIAHKERELNELRAQRNRLKTAVRALAPEQLPEAQAVKKNGSARKIGKPFGRASYEYVLHFLQGPQAPQGEFGSTSLVETPGYEGVSASSLPAILRQLHEDGVIRLVRKGKGSSRYYEVIR